jgi:CRP/FNR family transcriptional regulator, cyclic AMP receptor protein
MSANPIPKTARPRPVPPGGKAFPPRETAPAAGESVQRIFADGVSAANLRTFPLFANTPEHVLEGLARGCIVRFVPRNVAVVRAGEPSNFAYLILSGRMNVSVSDEDGREAILSTLAPDDLVGEMGILDGGIRSANVIAATPSVVIAITTTDFMRCMRENADVALYIMRNLSLRLRAANRKIESLALVDVAGRVAGVLREMAEARGGGQAAARKCSNLEIAKMVGASQEMVGRVLKKLAAARVIATSGGRPGLLGVRHS